MKHPDHIIPENSKGAKTDTVSSVTLPALPEAMHHYQTCKTRLLNVSKWHEYAGAASADFTLTNSLGKPKTAPAEKGDFFQISIPAPGTNAGDGYDWVEVEAIEEASNTAEDWEYTLIKVRPASSPSNPDPSTAHFFSEDANSYFLVQRRGNEVSAEVHGRNEQPNTETESVKDKIRNTIVAIGAMIGVSNAQWKSLTSGITAM